MPDYAKKIVYLSEAQYQELITNHTITVNGTTVVYDTNTIYITPQNTPLYPNDIAEWAKAANKPTYTAVEVGALPDNTVIPTKVSDLTDDSGHYTKPSSGIPASDLAANVIPNVPVQDVQVNNTSILSNSVANVPLTSSSNFGVMKVGSGLSSANGVVTTMPATSSDVKAATMNYRQIVPSHQHEAAFYGLAKAAGADMKDIANTTVGVYPDAQKEAIQSMLGVSNMLAPENSNLVASQAYAIGDVFTANGKLYKATVAIAQDGAIIPDTNCVETNIIEETIKDIQINSSSILSNNVANIPIAGANNLGVVKIPQGGGIGITSDGSVGISPASALQIRDEDANHAIAPFRQHYSVFFGLAKAAGDTTQSASNNTVGTYTDDAKIAIQKMLGVYQPPWELLNDITLSSEGSISLTADSNGTPYNILQAYMLITYSANLSTASAGYSRFMFYDENDEYVIAETGKYSTNANATQKSIFVVRNGNMVFMPYTRLSTTGGFGDLVYKTVGGLSFTLGNIVKIDMRSGDVEPAGTRIQIYGQRAY